MYYYDFFLLLQTKLNSDLVEKSYLNLIHYFNPVIPIVLPLIPHSADCRNVVEHMKRKSSNIYVSKGKFQIRIVPFSLPGI